MGIVSMMEQRVRRGPALKYAKWAWRLVLSVRMPVFAPLAEVLTAEREFRMRFFPLLAKIFYREPLLRHRCAHVGKRLHLEGEMPFIMGDGRIEIGDDVVLGSRNTWVLGGRSTENAELVIGNRVSVNFQTFISAAICVRIGDDTMLASGVQIYDNPSHPLSPGKRLRHECYDADQAKPVIIGRNVWVGANALILRGVEIGENSVVAAGSVVTKSVPPNTLVAGNPARAVRSIADGPAAVVLPADEKTTLRLTR